jgi:peptide/nickel transport system permease protein
VSSSLFAWRSDPSIVQPGPSRVRLTWALRVGIALAAFMAALLLIGPWVVGTDPRAQNADLLLQGPSAAHPLGTDQFGRDVLARLLDGGLASVGASGTVVLASLALGLLVGALAAALPGIAGQAVDRLIDVVLGLPGIVVAFAFVGALGPGLDHLVFGLVATGWAGYARLARGLALQGVRGLDVLSARLAGRSAVAAVRDHVLPRVLGQLTVIGTIDFGFTLVGLAGLSYLGLGVSEPNAEWGSMLRASQDFFGVQPWLLLGPCVAIAVAVAATSLIGEALKERART